MGLKGRVDYQSDVTDEEWAFVVPYLLLRREDSPQRRYDLRAVFNAQCAMWRGQGASGVLPNDMPPWYVVYQQMQLWLRWGCFEILVEDTALVDTAVGGPQGTAYGGMYRQPNVAVDAGIGCAGGLRQSQAQKRIEGAKWRWIRSAFAGLDRHSS